MCVATVLPWNVLSSDDELRWGFFQTALLVSGLDDRQLKMLKAQVSVIVVAFSCVMSALHQTTELEQVAYA
jgi:hypothetical protein